MACMTPAADGTRISIDDPEAVEFRRSVIEWLMMNHPHDCPVCDEGGECHLQDMTVMTGHDYRRYRFEKRTYRNQYLGPFVNHEMNRCIQCYRCVRFYRDYAGGQRFRRPSRFATSSISGARQDGVLESEFSGNLVEVCPTGVFTDKTLKQHYTRKWDLQTAPSVCVHCGLGCNTIPGERYGMLRRIVNRYHSQVNGYFLCDRGRYGYEFVNSPERIREPRGRAEVSTTRRRRIDWERCSPRARRSGSARRAPRSNRISFCAPPWARSSFFTGVADDELRLVRRILEIMKSGAARVPTLKEIELSDAVFVVGEDVSNTAPRMALSLQQSVRQQPMRGIEKLHIPSWNDQAVREAVQSAKGPLYIATPYATRLDGIATEVHRAAPDDIARLAFAVADAADESTLAGRIAAALKKRAAACRHFRPEFEQRRDHRGGRERGAGTRRGTQLHSPGSEQRGVGSDGRRDAGRGGRGRAHRCGRNGDRARKRSLPPRAGRERGRDVRRRRSTSSPSITSQTALTAKAELVLPAATFAEGDGTFVNNEGRAQRFFQVFVPGGDIRGKLALAARRHARRPAQRGADAWSAR